jgi:hypothetical protein
MLALILAFVLTVLGALAPQGLGNAPGLADPPTIPAAAEDHSQAPAVLDKSGRPDTVPADGADHASNSGTDDNDAAEQPEAKPVDTSDAPETVDLSGVPASDAANVPDEVGADSHADLPDQAGGDEAGPPSEVPPAQASDTGSCASSAHGKAAADCHNGG